MNNKLINMLGEIIGVADVVGGDFPAGNAVSSGILNATIPSSTPTGVNGASVLQLGNVSTNEIYSKNTEHWSGCPGVYSLPAIPASSSATDGCQVLYINRNDQNIGIAYRDTRFLTNAQMVNPGETVIYASGSKAMAKFGNDGGVTLSTQTSGGLSNYFSVTPSGIYMQCQFGSFSIDENGINMVSGAGSKISLAGLAGLGPLSSSATISAAVVNVAGTAVTLGNSPVMLPACIGVAPAPFGTPNSLGFLSTFSNSVLVSAI